MFFLENTEKIGSGVSWVLFFLLAGYCGGITPNETVTVFCHSFWGKALQYLHLNTQAWFQDTAKYHAQAVILQFADDRHFVGIMNDHR